MQFDDQTVRGIDLFAITQQFVDVVVRIDRQANQFDLMLVEHRHEVAQVRQVFDARGTPGGHGDIDLQLRAASLPAGGDGAGGVEIEGLGAEVVASDRASGR